MFVTGLPDFMTLSKLGVKRASMGPFLFNKIYKSIAELSETIIEDKNFSSIIS